MTTQRSILPYDIIGYTAEEILAEDASKTHLIYITIVLSLILTLVSLPLIKVTVSVQSNGIIRPTLEKNEVKALISGIVSQVSVKEGQHIEKNQVLLSLNRSVAKEKLIMARFEENEQSGYISDLTLLTSTDQISMTLHHDSFKTLLYLSEYRLFSNQIQNITTQIKYAKKEHKRESALYKKRMTSLKELELKELELSKLQIEYDTVVNEYRSKWNKALMQSKVRVKELSIQKRQTEKEKEYSIIKSPISGTVEQFSGITEGTYIQAGQLISIISPQKNLVAEFFVSPQDIGLIKVGSPVNIQVDSFNYNQWGLVKGLVIDISDDFVPLDNQPFFRVRCSLNNKYLQLKNGYKGYLKKGMTVKARFLIAKRSLFQLLNDQVDDWLNPIQSIESL